MNPAVVNGCCQRLQSQGPIPEDARLPARLRPVGDYAPEDRAYSSERRTLISAVAVTPGPDEISGLGAWWRR